MTQAFHEDLLHAISRGDPRHGSGSAAARSWSRSVHGPAKGCRTGAWTSSHRCPIRPRRCGRSLGAAPTLCHDLQIEQGTKFGQMYTPGMHPLPSESESANLYKLQNGFLKQGITTMKSVATASPDMSANTMPRRMKEYAEWVQNLEDGTWSHESRNSDMNEMAMDVVMLSLRTAWGLDLRSFSKSFRKSLTLSLCNTFKPFVESGLVIAMDMQGQALSPGDFEFDLQSECDSGSRSAFIRLRDSDGFLLSNELISLAFGIISP
ncbi:hypothetical protein PR202_gb00122 [Eleusine coracana subsp. coracana]|uniref:Uncharacterized protein n=1 Tax=Eleusine coracana subsp. coracana TaxID=191504 RepID=A0AAV5DR48_ELECO|nr:hypothetical protein PR202_gb00122 [Eleusine coracana subsp. coracana]